MRSRRVVLGCEFVYVAAIDTPAVLQVEPRDAEPITVESRGWTEEPGLRIRSYTDIYGNPCARLVLPAGRSTLRYSRVQAICDYVNSHLTFQYGSSSPQSTAVDVNASGFGVCRDFTHWPSPAAGR
jgi:transglutaminase-like putative cysteine protease